MQIGANSPDKVMIEAQEVTKIMLNGEEVYSVVTGFAITQHPQSQEGASGEPVFTFTVAYNPPEATVKWQWQNPTEQDVPTWYDISGATSDSYTMVDGGSPGLSIAQNDDRFRAIVSLAGESDITSNQAIVTVTQGDVQEMTGEAKDFLQPPLTHTYTNAGVTLTYENLDAEKVFPYGQQMPIVAHGIQSGYIADCERAGINIGFEQQKYSNSTDTMERLANAGIWYLGYLRGATPTSSGESPADSFDKYSTSELIDYAEAEMDRYKNDPYGGANIWGWCYPLDDGTPHVDGGKLKDVFDGMNAYDSRPNGSFGPGGMFITNEETRYMPEFSHMLTQCYFHGGSDHVGRNYEPNRCLHYHRETYGTMYYVGSEKTQSPPHNLPRVIPAAPGPWFWHIHEVPALEEDSDFASLEFKFILLTALMAGANAYWIYQLNRSYPTGYHSDAFADAVIGEFFDFLEILKVNGVTDALLWGDGKAPKDPIRNAYPFDIENVDYGTDYASPNGITRTRLAGNTDYTTRLSSSVLHNGDLSGWYSQGGSPTYDLDPLTWRDLKFKDRRFIIATNMMPVSEITDYYESCPATSNGGVIREEFSGLPTDGTEGQLKAVDILTGTEYPISGGKITVDIPASGSVIIKLEAAEGWIYPQ